MQTVGERLRNERERKGLTLKNVEADTNIRAIYLQAIEEGNYSLLPGETYVKGFIRNYANSLGLNGPEYVEMYRRGQAPQPPVPPTPVAPIEPKAPTPELSTQTFEPVPEQSQPNGSSSSRWLGLAVVLLLGSGAVWWIVSSASLMPQTPAEPQTPPQQIQQIAPSLPQQPQPPSSQQAPKVPVVKGVVVAAKFTNRSWIQVTADDKQVYEGIPHAGESMTWQASQKITIKVGNAGGVELTHNGQKTGKLGGNGEVVLKTFTAQ